MLFVYFFLFIFLTQIFYNASLFSCFSCLRITLLLLFGFFIILFFLWMIYFERECVLGIIFWKVKTMFMNKISQCTDFEILMGINVIIFERISKWYFRYDTICLYWFHRKKTHCDHFKDFEEIFFIFIFFWETIQI